MTWAADLIGKNEKECVTSPLHTPTALALYMYPIRIVRSVCEHHVHVVFLMIVTLKCPIRPT